MKLFLGILMVLFATQVGMAKEKLAKSVQPIECPPGDIDKTIDLIDASQSCERAATIARECAWGSSADAAIAGAAQKKCEKDFLSQMSKDEKEAYQKRLEKCWNLYKNEIGTMYIAFRAHCALDKADHFSKEFLKLQGGENCSCDIKSSPNQKPAATH